MALDRPSSERLLEFKRKQRRVRLIRITIFSFLCVACIGLLIYLSRIPAVQITDVVVRGNNIVREKDIQASVRGILAEYYFWIIPKSNILLVPTKTITQRLQTEFPRFKDVTVERIGGHTLSILVSERASTYLWCDSLPTSNATAAPESEHCYYVDDTGYIFSSAPYFSGTVYFKFFGMLWATDTNPVGQHVLDPQIFKQVIRFKENLETLAIEPKGFITYDTGLYGLLLSPVLDDNVQKIVFSKDNDIDTIADNLLAALRGEPLKSKFNSQFTNLEYIDLRYDKKVYYKFRE